MLGNEKGKVNVGQRESGPKRRRSRRIRLEE